MFIFREFYAITVKNHFLFCGLIIIMDRNCFIPTSAIFPAFSTNPHGNRG